MSKEFAIRVTREVLQTKELLKDSIELLEKTREEIRSLDESEELTIPLLKKKFKDCFSEIDKRKQELEKYYRLQSVYEEFIQPVDVSVWEEYFSSGKKFSHVCSDFSDFFKEYENYMPKNKGELEAKAKKLLILKGFVPDSYFEGDYATWIGVYARPKDKPTYLDANNQEEYLLQEKYSQNGFKRDFSEWFEWKVVNNELVEED